MHAHVFARDLPLAGERRYAPHYDAPLALYPAQLDAGGAVARPATPLLRAAFGVDRLVWGSDWPHTQFEKDCRFEHAYGLIHDLLPNDADRRAVLAETPARLFRFA